jgi:hypothetical protein
MLAFDFAGREATGRAGRAASVSALISAFSLEIALPIARS